MGERKEESKRQETNSTCLRFVDRVGSRFCCLSLGDLSCDPRILNLTEEAESHVSVAKTGRFERGGEHRKQDERRVEFGIDPNLAFSLPRKLPQLKTRPPPNVDWDPDRFVHSSTSSLMTRTA